MRKELVWKWYHSIGLPLIYYRWDFQTNQCRPHPARGLKLLREPCFYYLQTIIVSKYRHSVGLRHSFHIKHLIATTVLYILPDIWDDGNDRLAIINLLNNGKNPTDIRNVSKEPTAMFEFTTRHASFVDFFIKLRHNTVIGKQLLFANNRNRVR